LFDPGKASGCGWARNGERIHRLDRELRVKKWRTEKLGASLLLTKVGPE
jgi:hypothetical protein